MLSWIGIKNDDQDVGNRASSLCGYLWKLKRNQQKIVLVPQWNKRWFSIERHLLKWYASPQAEKASGVVDLRFVTDIAAFEAQSGAHSFVLAGPDRNLLLRAACSAEMEKWMRALQYQADIVRGGDGTGVVTDSASFCLSPQGKGRAIKDKYKPSTLEATLEAAMARLEVLESEVSKKQTGGKDKSATSRPVKAPRDPVPAALRGAQEREREVGSVRSSRSSFVREDAADGTSQPGGGPRDSRDGLRFNRPMMSPQRKIQSAQRAGSSRHHHGHGGSDGEDDDESGGDKYHSDGERPWARGGAGGSSSGGGGGGDDLRDQDQRQQHRARAKAVGRPRERDASRDRDAHTDSYSERERDRDRDWRWHRADTTSEDEAGADARSSAHRGGNGGSVRGSRDSGVGGRSDRDRDGQVRGSRDSDGALPPRHGQGVRRPPPSQPKWDQDFDDSRAGPGGHEGRVDGGSGHAGQARPSKGGKARPGNSSDHRPDRRAPGGAPQRRSAPARGPSDLVVSEVDDVDGDAYVDHELQALTQDLQEVDLTVAATPTRRSRERLKEQHDDTGRPPVARGAAVNGGWFA